MKMKSRSKPTMTRLSQLGHVEDAGDAHCLRSGRAASPIRPVSTLLSEKCGCEAGDVAEAVRAIGADPVEDDRQHRQLVERQLRRIEQSLSRMVGLEPLGAMISRRLLLGRGRSARGVLEIASLSTSSIVGRSSDGDRLAAVLERDLRQRAVHEGDQRLLDDDVGLHLLLARDLDLAASGATSA